MQNMNYYYDFSGQKFGYPLSLSINSFHRRVFSRETSLEITYVLKGEYEAITKHFTYPLKEQELIIIAPKDIHMIRPVEGKDNVVLTIHIDFALLPTSMVGEIKDSYESMVCTKEKNYQLLKKLERKIGALVQLLLKENKNLFQLNSLMMDLLYITSSHQQYPIDKLPLQSTHGENYMKAIEYIDKHYEEDLHLKDVATTLSFSISYTSKLFKKYTGIPFVKYLAYVRVRGSLEALLEGKKSIEEIAGNCGMPNSKAYTTTFKELYGIVPSEYRKQFINNLRFNEENKEEKMSMDQKQLELLQHLVKEAETTIYENDYMKIKSKGEEITCSIKTDKAMKSTITHSNEEIIINITRD